jgi:hypothetical protein
MSRTRLSVSDWVQILSSIAIVGGLVLVFFELQQSREVAEAQIASDQFAMLSAHETAMFGDIGAKSYAKACLEPDKLTGEEARVVTAYLDTRLLVIRRMYDISDRTSFYGDDNSRRSWTRSYVGSILNTEYGRLWWAQSRNLWTRVLPEAVSIGDEILADPYGFPDCQRWFPDYLKVSVD